MLLVNTFKQTETNLKIRSFSVS